MVDILNLYLDRFVLPEGGFKPPYCNTVVSNDVDPLVHPMSGTTTMSTTT